MKPFEYIAVETIAEACGVLAEHGAEARVLAGGTDLLIEWRRASTKAPKVVLDISRVPELGGIAESDGSITIRPLATHAELVRSDLRAEVRAAAGRGGRGHRVAADQGPRHGRRQHHERGGVRGYRAAAHCAGRDGDAAIARRAAGSWRWRTCSSSRIKPRRSRTSC